MNCAAFTEPFTVIGPLLPMKATGSPSISAQPQIVCWSYRPLNSRKSEPSTRRAITSRTSYGSLCEGGTTPHSSSMS